MTSPDTTPDASAQRGEVAANAARFPQIRDVTFDYRETGGYDHHEVDAFLHELADAADAAEAESNALRTEVAELRQKLDEEINREIAAEAVGMLSQAQLIAEKAIADAEQYARDVTLSARSQYRSLLEQAHSRAANDDTTRATDAAGANRSLAELSAASPEVDYVRTYARIAQVQLHAVLDALSEQVDRLGKLSEPDGPAELGDLASTDTTPVAMRAAEPVAAAPERQAVDAAPAGPNWRPRARRHAIENA